MLHIFKLIKISIPYNFLTLWIFFMQFSTFFNMKQYQLLIVISMHVEPGRVAQSVGHLTRNSGVLGSIPGLATYFRFSFRIFQEGQLSVTGESMCTKYWLTA